MDQSSKWESPEHDSIQLYVEPIPRATLPEGYFIEGALNPRRTPWINQANGRIPNMILFSSMLSRSQGLRSPKVIL